MFNALIVQRRKNAISDVTLWDQNCPTYRIPMVTSVNINTAAPGGWHDANFTIPFKRVRLDAEQYGSADQPNVVWLYDGLTVAFYGLVVKVTPQSNGDFFCECIGPYQLLAETRMREVWGDGDLTQLTEAGSNDNNASVNVNSDGDLVLSLAKGASPTGDSTKDLYNQGDHVAADYFLFGEAIGTRDQKKLTGWDVTLSGDANFGSDNVEVRIYGMSNPSDNSPTLLQNFQSPGSRIETADTTHGGENTVAWANTAGYRCFRIGLWVASAINHTAGDLKVKVTKFVVSTRATTPSRVTLSHAPSTTDIVQDIWVGSVQDKDLSVYVQEDNAATQGAMITGNITDSSTPASNIAYKAWSKPQEIVEMMATLDGRNVGMYEPTKNVPPGAYVASSYTPTVNYWFRQPPELRYEDWSDIGDPDYIIRLSRGAVWVPSTDQDELLESVYVNYTTRGGRSQSVYVEDATTENRMYEQNRRSGVDWSVDPPVGADTATSLGTKYIAAARQPSLSGELTLRGDRPGCIELPGGARAPKFVEVKPGVIRIVDAEGAKSGRITGIAYTGKSGTDPEMLVLTVNSPSSARLDRNLARLSHRADTSRTR